MLKNRNFIKYSYLFPYYCIFIARAKIRAAFKAAAYEMPHFVLIKINKAHIAVKFIIIFIVHTAVAIRFHVLSVPFMHADVFSDIHLLFYCSSNENTPASMLCPHAPSFPEWNVNQLRFQSNVPQTNVLMYAE